MLYRNYFIVVALLFSPLVMSDPVGQVRVDCGKYGVYTFTSAVDLADIRRVAKTEAKKGAHSRTKVTNNPGANKGFVDPGTHCTLTYMASEGKPAKIPFTW